MLANKRELVYALLAMAIAFVLAYVLIVISTEVQSETQLPAPPPPSAYSDLILELDRQAIEEAYKRHVIKLFENWVLDVKGQPARALRGVETARRAFIDSMTAIDARRTPDGTLPPRPRSIEQNIKPQGK